MKTYITPLVLFLAIAIFAQQQQDTIPVQALPLPIADSTSQLPVITPDSIPPLLPQPLPPPQDTMQPLPPLPPLPPLDTIPPLIPLPPQDTIPPLIPLPQPDTIPLPPKDSVPTPKDTVTPPPPPPAPVPEPQPQQPSVPSMPRNTITVDVGPTIVGVAIGIVGEKLLDKNTSKASAFGIAGQYEFQIFKYLSLGLRFAYMDLKAGFVQKFDQTDIEQPELPDLPDLPDLPEELSGEELPDVELPDMTVDGKAELKTKINIYSIEAHPRIYPFGGSFFIEGMAGYANLTADLSGEVVVDVEVPITDPILELDTLISRKETRDAKLKPSRSYLKYGGKLGWRVDFGKPGGFIFEHALGFYAASGLGKTIVKKLSEDVKKETGEEPDIEKFDDIFEKIEKFILIGGPRYTFAFGWRF